MQVPLDHKGKGLRKGIATSGRDGITPKGEANDTVTTIVILIIVVVVGW